MNKDKANSQSPEKVTKQLLIQRQNKAWDLKKTGVQLYRNDFRVEQSVAYIINTYGAQTAEEFESVAVKVITAGRIVALRKMGKASFLHIQDDGNRLQAYIKQDDIGKDEYKVFKKLDVGDFIGLKGTLFRTKTGELTILAHEVTLLSKSMRPLPEKYHWLTDKEQRYRQRYLDLIGNKDVREVFIKRTKIIQAIREFMNMHEFIEVETPMMQVIAGGATAKPFETFHNALGIPLYLRIAPELYLKRLIVGGFNRVYEINRNFRNEGISQRHNPEFTMLEFYQAYATYEHLMDMTEELFQFLARSVNGSLEITYQKVKLDFSSPWNRMTLTESLHKIGNIESDLLKDRDKTLELAQNLELKIQDGEKHGKILAKLFDALVEPNLIQPTFITHYPTDVSPLARRNSDEPDFVDRFELFIGGREIANAFSELNDPEDQRNRFNEQVEERQAGDEEAHLMDEDYVKALEYGMPPTAGEGIGVDRLVMLLSDSPSIRDVILFPHMKPT